jgi:DNA replication protein DnaC
MDKYLAFLGESKVEQRYKSRFEQEDVFLALKKTYEKNVIKYQNIDSHIQKVSRWLCGDFKAGLLLYGTIGSGKTTLMNSLVKFLTITEPGISKGKYSAIDIAEKFEQGEKDFIIDKKMLFIDDLGEEPLTIKNYGNERSPLIELLYKRYDRKQFTIITTNLLEKEIEETYGARIADRMHEMFDRIYFDHASFRRKK